MAGIGMIFGLIGSVMSAAGQAQAANASAAAQEAEAAALEKRAMEERAIATVNAEKKTDESRKLQSEQLARFASSGGGVGGTASTVIAETEKEGLQNNRLAVWQGEQKGRGYEDQAAIKRFAADQQRQSAGISAGSAILGGVSKVFGGGGSTNIRSEDTGFGGSFYFG